MKKTMGVEAQGILAQTSKVRSRIFRDDGVNNVDFHINWTVRV